MMSGMRISSMIQSWDAMLLAGPRTTAWDRGKEGLSTCGWSPVAATTGSGFGGEKREIILYADSA